jgi:hypothetical protein
MRSKLEFLENPGGLFKSWQAASLSQLAYYLKPETFLPRDVIACQGAPIDRYIFIKSGEVLAMLASLLTPSHFWSFCVT